MNFRTLSFIVRRLCFGKKQRGIVHIISLIALTGIAVGTLAMVTVLSVFNGFTDTAGNMLKNTCPPLLAEPVKGRIIDKELCVKLSDVKGVSHVIAVIKQTALMTVGENRSVVTVMGIDSSYFYYNALNEKIVNGKEMFSSMDSLTCITGVNQAVDMGLNRGSEKMSIPVKLTVPNTEPNDAMVMDDNLKSINLVYTACYQTHSDLDQDFVFISYQRAAELTGIDTDKCNYLYILSDNENNIENIQKKIQEILPAEYSVKNILQQEPVYFRIVKSEKLAVFIILAFIVFIATVNIITAMIILYIQKEKMNGIFLAIGMRFKDLRKIYFAFGTVINTLGCITGLVAGLILCLIQQHFGVVKLAKDSFVVDAFPVKIMFTDILLTFAAVIIIGCLSVYAVTLRIKETK
ncbi:MAG: ABC transporter permease [Bacteroidales bacterium]|nr:ABC transporter permease [Bacteroidales bacterium]